MHAAGDSARSAEGGRGRVFLELRSGRSRTGMDNKNGGYNRYAYLKGTVE